MSERDLFFCPLECGARIKSLKHINKCKNYNLLGVKYRLCEYNATHIIKNELYQIHLLSCSSKKKFEEDKNESFDDNLSDKFSASSDEEKKEEEEEEKKEKEDKNKKPNQTENNIEEKNENEDNNIIKKRWRYRHERALYKDEQEIDQECLDFFNKVYV